MESINEKEIQLQTKAENFLYAKSAVTGGVTALLFVLPQIYYILYHMKKQYRIFWEEGRNGQKNFQKKKTEKGKEWMENGGKVTK